ncbi:hypothetical protein NW754_011002 [Fusarium falciforme]|nr:hypothetical protein NW754_011002 [Fusarium falciforme]KAJ4258499.1 hypothetical protein NW757_003067 [Fusarium falciforme]
MAFMDTRRRTYRKKLEELETEGRIPWLERFNEEWQVSEETAKKALDMAYQGIATVLPDYDGTLAGQVAQAEIMWKNGEFSSAANPNGPMTVYRTAGLMIALDIYLWLGKEEEAQTTFERICGRLQYEEQVEQLACSRMAWKKLLTRPSRPILDVLQIHPAKLRPAVTRALQMAEHRLEHGPKRRYKGESIEKLAHTVSANAFHNCPYNVLAAYRPPEKPRSPPRDAHGLLRPPCYPSDIADLEKRLGVTLPEDYKEFLSVANGLGSMWNGQNLVDYLVKAEDICWQDIDFLGGNCIPLLRDDDPSPWTDNRLDWPEVGSFLAICLSGNQNNEESNGHLFLLPPGMVQERKDYFFKEYEKRNDSQRRELGHVVEETYGSMEDFRNLEYVLISWTP